MSGGSTNWKILLAAHLLGFFSAFLLLTVFTQFNFHIECRNDSSKNLISMPFNVSYVEKKWNTLNQTDPQLVQYARVKFLNPPLTSSQPEVHHNSSAKPPKLRGVTRWVVDFFREKRNGLFIEAGAYKGDSEWSNTFYLEKVLGWTGLLVECNPVVIPELLMLHRRAWVATVCLAPGEHPQNTVLRFPPGHEYTGNTGKNNHPPPFNQDYAKMKWKTWEVKGIPLYTLIAALGYTEIDFFSFDVEKMELRILKSFPFDKVIFKVLAIEVYWYSQSEKDELTSLLAKNGYLAKGPSFGFDRVYVHKSVSNFTN